MRLLDKYILKAFVGPFLFGVFAFTIIFIGTGTLFRIAQYITEYGAPLLLVMQAFVLALPSIVILTFPMSVLLASLMTFSRLSSTSEIVVMRASYKSYVSNDCARTNYEKCITSNTKSYCVKNDEW